MKKTKKTWDVLTDDQRHSSIQLISRHLSKELDEDFGLIASEELLDFFLEKIGGHAYNKGVSDARTMLKERFEDLDLELDLLQTGTRS